MKVKCFEDASVGVLEKWIKFFQKHVDNVIQRCYNKVVTNNKREENFYVSI